MYRWNLTNGKNVVQTEKMRNGYSQKRYGMICISNNLVESIRLRGWSLEKILLRIGRKNQFWINTIKIRP
jgi:hypothetical protein